MFILWTINLCILQGTFSDQKYNNFNNIVDYFYKDTKNLFNNKLIEK